MALICPRDGTELTSSKEESIPCDRCPTCSGEWLTLEGLVALEASAAGEAALAGTIEYSLHPDGLKCPSCAGPLQVFDFRGNNLQLDACENEHGFWLDAGEADGVRRLMRQRMADLQRSGSAEAVWNHDRAGGFRPSFGERLSKMLFGKKGL